MNCATGKGVTVKAKDKRYPTREIRKLDGKTTSMNDGGKALIVLENQNCMSVSDTKN